MLVSVVMKKRCNVIEFKKTDAIERYVNRDEKTLDRCLEEYHTRLRSRVNDFKKMLVKKGETRVKRCENVTHRRHI